MIETKATSTGRFSLRTFLESLSALGKTPASNYREVGSPLPPSSPPGTLPRAYDVRTGRNLTTSPRTSDALTAFASLRSLSDFDLVRVVISDVLGQIRGLRWEVRLRKEVVEVAGPGARSAFESQTKAVRAWVECPDPLARIDFDSWLATVAEEVLVTDALSLVPRRTVGGEWIGLEQIDGATILPIVDDRGRPPLPPEIAFEQVSQGIVETGFTLDDLWYIPRNRRATGPYGRSPVEQVMLSVLLALRHSLHDLAYFTDGNLPDSLFAVPETWSQSQIDEYQAFFDELLSGRSDRRSGTLRFVPKGEYIPTKTREWSYEFLEWLARVIAWSFNVSPMPVAKMLNRATAEAHEASTTESGIKPLATFLASIVNRGIREGLGIEEIEFAWSEEDVEDPRVIFERNVAYIGARILTRDEVRQTLGKEPNPKLDEEPPAPPNPFASGPMGPKPKASPEADEEAEPEEEPEEEDDPSKDGFSRYFAAAKADLRKFRRAALKRAKAGKAAKSFESEAIPPASRARIEDGLRG
jgi:hypothetical protein